MKTLSDSEASRTRTISDEGQSQLPATVRGVVFGSPKMITLWQTHTLADGRLELNRPSAWKRRMCQASVVLCWTGWLRASRGNSPEISSGLTQPGGAQLEYKGR